MWLNGGYYYRGRAYGTPEELTLLGEHLSAPVPTENTDYEGSWREFFTFVEVTHRPEGEFSGEDWPQILDTWDRVLFPHMGERIEEASDMRRIQDVCMCVVERDNSGDWPDTKFRSKNCDIARSEIQPESEAR